MTEKEKGKPMPTVDELEMELSRVQYRNRYGKILRNTVFTLITVAATAVLVAVLFLPVLQIYGHSMAPGLEEGDIVAALKGAEFQTGDVVAFYYNNKILVKRVIAGPGDWVDIDAEGNVSVNGKALDEPYLSEKSLGECDINLPCQVPENRWFLMGDHRSVSVDSRSSAVGCVSGEEIVGRLVFRAWPLEKIGFIK